MGKAVLSDIERAGLRERMTAGHDPEELRAKMPVNKRGLTEKFLEEVSKELNELEQKSEVEESLQKDLAEVFDQVKLMMKKRGYPEGVVERLFIKLQEEDLGDLEPDATQIYNYCMSKFGGGMLISTTSDGGRSGVYSMNAAAAEPKLNNVQAGGGPKLQNNIFRPNG